MEQIHWPLTVLCRAIHYKNLTGASHNIGISQPQLSRIIAKLEDELKLTLLDRTSKRSASWTPTAFELVDIYTQSSTRLQHSLTRLQKDQLPTQLTVGALEGLLQVAMECCKSVMDRSDISYLRLDAFDLNDLEAAYLSGDLDLVFTSRVPGRRTPKYEHILGFQNFVKKTGKSYEVFSPFEYSQNQKKTKKSSEKTVVSNSLRVRRHWVKEYGGKGQYPTELKTKGEIPVIMLGAEMLHSDIWDFLTESQ